MPASPELAEDLAARVRELYDAAEVALLERLATALAEGIESPKWAELKFAAVGDLRRAVEQISTALEQDANGAVAEALIEAYGRGEQAAVAELGAVPVGHEPFIRRHLPNSAAVDRLAASYARDTRPLYARITRAVVDVFRSIVTRVSGGVLLGTETRRQASQRALNAFAARGVTGFIDRAGRSWDMAAYAEMSVRSVTARAAIDGHTDHLQALGLSLVIVSDAPLECPLCAPWEGEVLAINGQDGPHTVHAEHTIEDDRIVTVHVVGSLLEARAAGLFHPNCRHSLSAYFPGVTKRPQSPPHPQSATYEDTQHQRYLERQVRAWKRRQAAAMDDDARKRAGAKVREYQARIRQHTEETGLRRKREREQLPKTTTPPTLAPETVQAARVRTDPGALREMSEAQLADAIGSGRLDADDLGRVQAEVDRREQQSLMDRVRPAGRLAEDLTGFSDDELGRALPHLTPEEALRVAAEMDRRDTDAALPGARRDLIGLSDEQLGLRARNATGDELAVIAAEADRRQLLAAVFPGGRLADDLSGLDEDTLGWALRYATAHDAARIAAEIDRRHPPAALPPASADPDPVAAQLADFAAIDEILGPIPDSDEWAHLTEDLPDDPRDSMTAAERWIADQEEAQESARTAYTREQIRDMYAQLIYTQFLQAEDELRGYLLTKRADLDGVHPISLFSGPAHIAYARASEELKRWWQTHPRTTLAEYTEQVRGVPSEAAEKARQSSWAQQQKL